MPLPDIRLDDRSFQDIVNEAKALIPRYCPEWTDHNVSDPGVTMIELFAWMTDLLLYRMNRVPEKNYIRFMELIGMGLKEPVPARTRLTFMLTAAQPGPVTIARGTEVATVRTGDREAIPFTTDEDLLIWPPTLRHFLFSSDGATFTDYLPRLQAEDEYFDAFQRVPIPGDALYYGFAENLSSHIVSMHIDCTVEGIGVDPKDPPLAWEAWCGDLHGWQRARVELDQTGGLNQSGEVMLALPPSMEPRVMARQGGYWLRLRVLQPRPRQPEYSASPRINLVRTEAIGGTAMATHSTVIQGELLGRTTGVPGETFTLHHTPLLPRRADEYVETQLDDGTWVHWEEVSSFRDSGPSDHHYTLDGVTGTITFGPTIRQRDGSEHAYGATAGKGLGARMTRYRSGGGLRGNVGANTLTVLKSSIPYVASVTNSEAATGGLDAETLDAAKMRAPQALRTQDRAVTAEDYQFLAREASRRVARAYCIQSRTDGVSGSVPAGTVELLVVPIIPADLQRTQATLQPPPDLLEEVRAYLDDRRLLGTQLVVDGPAYVGVSVEASILVRRGHSADAVRQAVTHRIVEYLDPLLGGPTGDGWPFGRDLYLSEMQSVVQSVDGVEYAQDVTLFQVDLQLGTSRAAGQRVTLPDDVLILPLEPVVTVVATER
ncbi:MAG: putative baseplate assembly protein [Dehalococcoidia bacterium]|nr:putative baseplate assembly protein [Dehalococcoidia bacterium]